ncbi:hypothetical protein QE435_000671 [Rhizobium sp. SORGH_AS 787]|nr:hypothetical protein [Rhizobium sp. SORGH_AS_0787]
MDYLLDATILSNIIKPQTTTVTIKSKLLLPTSYDHTTLLLPGGFLRRT